MFGQGEPPLGFVVLVPLVFYLMWFKVCDCDSYSVLG